MKYFLIAMLMFIVSNIRSQNMLVTITAGNEKMIVSDEDSVEKIFKISKTNAIKPMNYLTVMVSNETKPENWKRSFFIYTEDDSAVTELKPMMKNEYCVDLVKLLPILQKDKKYYLYTVALPTNHNEAMLVKPARKLICKLVVN